MFNFNRFRKNLASILFLVIAHYAYSAEIDIDSGVKILTYNLQNAMPIGQPSKIAIMPFRCDKHDLWSLCRVVTELTYTQIGQIEGVNLVDRQTAIQAMANTKIMAEKGLLKNEDIAELKEQLKCDIIITGHIADESTIININAFVWQTDNGNLLATKSSQIRKTASIIALFDQTKAENHEIYSIKWKSPIMQGKILGASVNDLDGDKINEFVIVAEEELKVLSWDGFGFIDKFSAKYANTTQRKRNQKDMQIIYGWDADSDGKDEIYLSIPDVETSIWKWQKDALVRTGTLPFTLFAECGDKIYSSLLKNNRNYFLGQKTYEISKTDNTRIEKPVPKDFYSVSIGQTNDLDDREYVLVDIENIMRIFSDDMSQIWQNDMPFGKNIIIADLDNNKRNEIIGTSALPMGDEDYIIVTEWNGETYAKKWESQRINGSISALCVGDPNNDGVDELIVIASTKGGSEIYLYTADYPQ